MKKNITLLLLCAAVSAASQIPHSRLPLQEVSSRIWDAGLDHRVMAPGGAFAGMGRLKGFGLYAGTRFFNNRVQAQVVYSVVNQPVLTDKKKWATESGAVRGQVNQESWLFNTALQLRYNITDKRGLNPFVTAGGGLLQALGKVRLYGKEEVDCPLLVSAPQMRSMAPYALLGGGLSLATGWYRASDNQGRVLQNLRIELSFQYLHSANMQLFNTRRQDAPLPNGATPVYISFTDAETRSVVRQRTGHLLEGRMQGLMFNLTLMHGFSIGGKKETSP